jgi:hypothetical protein
MKGLITSRRPRLLLKVVGHFIYLKKPQLP